jgi:outer membrane protein assembly factor BamB
MASSTPCADAQGVYLTWSTHEFFRATALDHAGKELWTTEMGAYKTQHGGAASPIVVDDMVIVAVEQEDLSGYLAGLDRSSGKVLWKRERGESQPTPYSTPLVYQPKNGLKQLLCTSTAYGITSLDPKTGKTYWETGSLFKLRTVGSPVLIDDLVVLGCGSGAGGNHAFAVRLPAQPEGKPEVVSKMLRGTAYVPTGVASDDRLYFWGDNGIVSCLDPKSGEVAWSERAAERTFGSPVLIDGKLYAISAKGELVVAEVGESFKLLGKSDLGEPSHSTPAVAGGVLYLRTETQLISLGGKKRSEGAG